MTYGPKKWNDHIVEFPNRFRETANPDGTITLEKQEGKVIQEGTPVSASNMNDLEKGAYSGVLSAAVLSQIALQHQREIQDSKAETGTITLTNTQQYPFNNSIKTIPIVASRNTAKDYEVSLNLVSADGPVGQLKISGKQTNGFKVEYTGSAKNVVLKYFLRGGIQ